MKPGSLRNWIAVIFLILASLFSGYYSFFINPPNILIDDDGAEKWESRMQPVRAELPGEVHEVGYISDPDFNALVQEYSLTRYALAPVAVRQGAGYEWIVGNFTEPGFESSMEELISTPYKIQGFGSGIYLIHRTLP